MVRLCSTLLFSPSISEQYSVSSVVWCTWSHGTVLATAILVSVETNDTEIMQRRAGSDFYETKFRAQHTTELLILGEQNGAPLPGLLSKAANTC